jgi:carboxyl-terminal processing protease
MFFQRRRLQVLLSILVITVASLYLGGQLLQGRAEPDLRIQDSQFAEAYFLLQNSYVHKLETAPLLEGALDRLVAEVEKRKLDSQRLPARSDLLGLPGEAGLRRTESYIERVAQLDPSVFPREEVIYAALAGMTDTLSDPYTVAMNPSTFARFNEGLHSHVVGGVGLQVEWTHGAYVVFEVQDGGPAGLAGIKPGDELLAVDGVPLFGPDIETEPLENVRFLLQGEVGTGVSLRLRRAGAIYSRTLKRATFKTRSVRGRLLGQAELGEPLVGWISVESLGEATGHEMAETLAELQEKGAEGFVMDLRDNVGGYLNAAVDIASMFLPPGKVVVVVAGRSGERTKQTIGASPLEAPLTVLVNSRTASSAEILAGAFQDYGRARLLGCPTFGKGSVQTIHDFADGGGFKMTTAVYLTPKKRVLEGKGLQPDLEIDVSQGRDESELHQEVVDLCLATWTAKR